jgi:5,10-methylene-tetrahydrofolate dehydrogenase/methenyl tetrahydrofolate cyclohydrolase
MGTVRMEKPLLLLTGGSLLTKEYSQAGTYLVFSSEVVGRPLAALLANDGARVFSVDIDSIQVIN